MNPDGEKKALIENVSREALEKALADGSGISPDEKPSEPKRQPPGTVERILNFMDRNLLVGAARQFCNRDGHKGIKDRSKLVKLEKLVEFEETIDYFAMIDDALEDETIKWQGARERYKTWRGYRSGAVTVKQVKENYPDFDFEKEPDKPSLRAPETPKDEVEGTRVGGRRGPARAFHFPSKLDAWVQDVLKDAEWNTAQTEFGLALSEKFGVEAEN